MLEDADVDYAVAAAFSVFMNSGQICMSADRVQVHSSVAEEFTAKFVAKVASLAVGDPTDPVTVVGPLASADSAQRVAALVEDAVAKGARVLTGGGEPRGAVHPATVLTDVPTHAEIFYGEAFGPVCVVSTFATDDEAVSLANDTTYGLTCGILTENGTHGLAVARRIHTGMCTSTTRRWPMSRTPPSVGSKPPATAASVDAGASKRSAVPGGSL